jgi:hypothetical protein
VGDVSRFVPFEVDIRPMVVFIFHSHDDRLPPHWLIMENASSLNLVNVMTFRQSVGICSAVLRENSEWFFSFLSGVGKTMTAGDFRMFQNHPRGGVVVRARLGVSVAGEGREDEPPDRDGVVIPGNVIVA